jgi:hypothetical protein
MYGTGSVELDTFLTGLTHLWVDDPDHILAAMATAVSVAVTDGEPLWLMLVSPSSGGKGEALGLIGGVADRQLKDVTLAGLLSRSQGRTSRETGVLTELQGANALVTITDFSALLGGDRRSGSEKVGLFNALRDIYDGEYIRTMNGGEAKWSGRLTLASACTPAIDQFASHSDSLGTRWLYFRMDERDPDGRRHVMDLVVGRKNVKEARARARDHATAIVEAARGRVGWVELTPRVATAVRASAMLASYGRANVPRDSWGRREINDVPDVEEPGRVAHQLEVLARSLLALGVSEERVLRIVCRSALGSMPAARSRAIQAIASGGQFSTYAVAKETSMDKLVAQRALEDWEAIRVIHSNKTETGLTSGESHAWTVDPEHADDVAKIVNVGGRR